MKSIDELGISPTPWNIEGTDIRDVDDYCVHDAAYKHPDYDHAKRMMADARLFYAAPDMYEALELCERKLDAIDPYCELLSIVRTALAKAAGEDDAK